MNVREYMEEMQSLKERGLLSEAEYESHKDKVQHLTPMVASATSEITVDEDDKKKKIKNIIMFITAVLLACLQEYLKRRG
ncbi:MAG: hypothetical protein J5781_04290 [Clostridia bacterium]|nr:hypothetical protein [Clostridia bacterium]